MIFTYFLTIYELMEFVGRWLDSLQLKLFAFAMEVLSQTRGSGAPHHNPE